MATEEKKLAQPLLDPQSGYLLPKKGSVKCSCCGITRSRKSRSFFRMIKKRAKRLWKRNAEEDNE